FSKINKTESKNGKVEVQFSKAFLQYVSNIRNGVLIPSKVDGDIKRVITRWGAADTLTAFSKSSPGGWLRKLPPKTPEYTRLMKAKLKYEKQLGRGGWGAKVPAKSLKPGQSGPAVVALRNRLISMGYLRRSNTQTYDANIQKAVQQFQIAHGRNPDGVAGKGTIADINTSVQKRLEQIMVAMERERWMNRERGKRHVLVNLTDFTARIIDNGSTTFVTRSVIGKNVKDQRSPEFSDVMEHMVINPTWNVPRSIATKEYLPMLKRNPNAVSHLKLVDSRGRTVNRSAVDFTQFTERSFPFNIKQPPSRRNALGLVKFIFPNPYNIYLHDTPSKNLFNRESRAFSHGCIRLGDPFDFAYALLKKQTRNPEEFFKARLKTGKETVVQLEKPVPVHLIYRTAFTQPKGPVNFRRDVYGRDAKILRALTKAGVVLRSVGS
ncbi:MAG: L,D-transpeptidase family protein, partial [Halocynthiibacter sp.]